MVIDKDKIYNSNNYGPFKILGYAERLPGTREEVIIQFQNTGSIVKCLSSNVLKGNVKDPNSLPLRDISNFSEQEKQNFIIYKLRQIWKDMIRRCTNKTHKEYYAYGGNGVQICDDWLNSFDTFVNDCNELFQYDKFILDPYNYQLDKDYLQLNIPKDMRIYSKNTCIFLSKRDNRHVQTIDRNISMKGKLSSEYYGVSKINNWYVFGITVNGRKKEIRFDNEIAAANAFNYWFEYFHNYDIVRLHNDVPYMSQEEINSHIVFPKEMCKIIR